MSKIFRFSIIVPVYNTAPYLKECFDSIINQTIGFNENIQLVIINDGSSDNSAAICAEYAKAHPENIVFVDKENGGVSTARNIGLEKATGEYINFLDSDDYWSNDVCECMDAFFHAHPEVRIAAAKHIYFGERTTEHYLSYKFEFDQIFDLTKHIDCPQLSFSNAFVAKELFEDKAFNPNLKTSEDFLLINTMMLSEMKYGALSQPVYWYRKRSDFSSALDLLGDSLTDLYNQAEQCYLPLIAESKRIHGCVIGYIQYCLMNDIQWKLRRGWADEWPEQDLQNYRNLISSVLTEIDDAIICLQRVLSNDQKIHALALKRGMSTQEFRSRLSTTPRGVFYAGELGTNTLRLFPADNETHIDVESIVPEGRELVISGKLATVLARENVELIATTKQGVMNATLFDCPDTAKTSKFETDFIPRIGFSITVPRGNFSFMLKLGCFQFKPKIAFDKVSPLLAGKYSYISFQGGVLTYNPKTYFRFAARKRQWILDREKAMIQDWKSEGFNNSEILSLRKKTWFNRYVMKNQKKPWLIGTSELELSDESKAALKEALDSMPASTEHYFVAPANSKAFQELSAHGFVIAAESKQHKEKSLQAAKIIALDESEAVGNAFGQDWQYVADLQLYWAGK